MIEERGIETLLAGKPQLCHALSLILRTGNTFLGSLLWVDFVRLLGLWTAGVCRCRCVGVGVGVRVSMRVCSSAFELVCV